MREADKWLLKELGELSFKPYQPLLPTLTKHFSDIREVESRFLRRVGNKLTKRQAVALGLLARTYQLSVSMLVNQLMQNYAGWSCSYRGLLETFFVADWLSHDPQRFESYFEGTAPGIGRIKNATCARHPELVAKYASASNTTHVGSRALHLPMRPSSHCSDGLPFAAVEMSIAGSELESMMLELRALLDLLVPCLQRLMIGNFETTDIGEVLWDGGTTKAKFGCLGYAPSTKRVTN